MNARQLAHDFVNQKPADPLAFIQSKDYMLLGEKAEDVLADLYREAGWLGWASSFALIKNARRIKKDVNISIDVDWSGWKPGDPVAAAKLLGDVNAPGLMDLLEKRQATIKGIEETRYKDLARVLSDGVEQGSSMDTIASNIVDYLKTDAAWAEVVARTEVRAAVTAAAMDSYREAHITMKEWLVAWDEACELCQSAEDMGPIPLEDDFGDAGDGPPGHPNCLCVILPVIGEAAEAEAGDALIEEPEPFDPDGPSLPSDVVLGTKYGDAAGSNRAGVSGFWEGTDGVNRYVKEYQNPEQAWSELLANRLYGMLGAESPTTALSTYADANGVEKTLLVTRIVENSGTVGQRLTTEIAGKIVDHFAADLWLANYDAVGTGLDNVVRTATGVARIDSGGSLLFRAMGSLKTNDLKNLFEVKAEPFFTTNKWYSRVLTRAGYKSADDMDILPSQVRGIRSTVDAAGGTRKIIDDLIGQIESTSGPLKFAVDRDVYSRLLDERLKSLETKYGTVKVKPVINPGMSALDAGQQRDRYSSWPEAVHTGKAKVFGPRSGVTWGNKFFDKWQNDVLADAGERQAVRSYTGSGYGPMNGGLRADFRAGNAVVSPDSQILMDALSKAVIPQDILVTRGVQTMSDAQIQVLRSLKVGDIMHDYGFMSTAVAPESPGFTGAAVIRIKVPKGSQGGYLGKTSAYQNREKELLLQAGTSIRVEAIHQMGSGYNTLYIIDATLVDQVPGKLVTAAYYAGKAVRIWIL